MNDLWKNNNKLIIVMFIGIFIATTSLMVYSILSVTSYNKSMTSELVVDIKSDYMKEIIDNLVIRIETMESDNIRSMQDSIQSMYRAIEQDQNQDKDEEYLKNLIELHNHDSQQVNALIYDLQSEELVYENIENVHSQISLTDKIQDMKDNSPAYKEVRVGQNNVILYVTWDDIYTMTKAQAYAEIHNMNYETNQYVWVNKVVNYDGGDDYAIRLIHPNMKESEGEYLSTHTQDIAGNYPYQTELDAVKENGEILYQYYFKNLENDAITQKISYAYLYEKYDWIIATGIPTQDLDMLVADIDTNSNTFIFRNMIVTFMIFAFGIMGSLYFLIKKQNQYLVSLKGIVKEETELDVLTGAFSRKYGTNYSEKSFANFLKTGINTTFFILDIDDFKIVNDTYGHATGDILLKQLTQTILSIIRCEDCFIRWGGEEFVLVMNKITKTEAQKIADSIVEHVSYIEFEGNDSIFNITVSIGGSMLLKTDTSYKDVLARADRALYNVKKHGKNRALMDVDIVDSNLL